MPAESSASSPWKVSEQSLTDNPRRVVSEAEDIELRPQLEAGMHELGLPADIQLIDRLLQYLGEMIRWNKTYNLTAIRNPSEMVVMHLLDSLSVLPVLNRLAPKANLHLVDVGTGAGLPGIPLKLARPDLRLTLVETNGKKAAFLRHVQARLALTDTEVCQARVEDVQLESLRYGPVDILTCRAFRAMDDLLELVEPLVGSGTTVLALKGPAAAAELVALKRSFEQQTTNGRVQQLQKSHGLMLESITVPGLEAERAVVVMAPEPTTNQE